ncbi:MAG: hypothetical protein Q7J09_10595 [Methanocalculus sp.]|jgi:predicted AlkP superfamily pyrophosphatase or phosphodiesterase|uniref:DUF7123 family protein n=1 Tax=Methanocalculus sp. TaxID=2004547 RepID=UPI0027244D8F|nr:hypothetical protein [Methanocalculus sp.]MDO8841690.1 hypothetical protein [Methanocalculus sp.]MDO9540431.1 hypothetical protein [Methanocalculus sp.]
MTVPDTIRDRYNDTQDRILKYLRGGIQKGRHFFKSKYIASDLGLSSKEVGTNLAILSEICDDLEIKRWSYSNSTTWMVTPRAI